MATHTHDKDFQFQECGKKIEELGKKLREAYAPYKEKADKALADIRYEIMWSEKMPPEKRTLTAEKLKEFRKLFIAALQEEKDMQKENDQEHSQ